MCTFRRLPLGGDMTNPDAPIRTTHVGSLVRPAELVAYLRKIDAGDDYDEQEYESPGGDWACVAPVTYTGGEVIARDIANLKAAMDAAGAQAGFLPVVAPASCFPNLIDEHYGSEEAALLGIADALAEEYRAIVDAGLNLQIDDAYIPFMYDVLVPPGTMDDYRAWAQPRITALNHALEGIPQDKVRYHVSWG